jgi:hypothetical protein
MEQYHIWLSWLGAGGDAATEKPNQKIVSFGF